MTSDEIRFLRVAKSGRCGICKRRQGSRRSEYRILRFAVADEHYGWRGLGICKDCLASWTKKLSSKKTRPDLP